MGGRGYSVDEGAEWSEVLERAVRNLRDDDFPVHEADDLRRHLRKARLNPVAVALTILHLEDMDPFTDYDLSIV